jgi:hypothetical protein
MAHQFHERLHLSDLLRKTDQPVVVDHQGLEWQLTDRRWQVTQLVSAEIENESSLAIRFTVLSMHT